MTNLDKSSTVAYKHSIMLVDVQKTIHCYKVKNLEIITSENRLLLIFKFSRFFECLVKPYSRCTNERRRNRIETFAINYLATRTTTLIPSPLRMERREQSPGGEYDEVCREVLVVGNLHHISNSEVCPPADLPRSVVSHGCCRFRGSERIRYLLLGLLNY